MHQKSTLQSLFSTKNHHNILKRLCLAKGFLKKIFVETHKPSVVLSETKNIEIHLYDSEKHNLVKCINIPVLISPSTATITIVSAILFLEAFQRKSAVFIDNENLTIPDTVASRGL